MVKNRKKGRGKRLLALLFIAMLVAAGSWAYSVWVRIYSAPEPVDDYIRDESIVEEPEKNITNVLIVGTDQRPGESGGRADSIIVMSFNQDTDEVSMISIPRDARVEIPGRGLDKINHALAYGGVNLIRATTEKLLGIPIHHYVSTNFAGFLHIVDTLDGVTMNVERDIYVKAENTVDEVTLKRGEQRLNGAQALAYVRFRKDQEGDYGRMRRQQQFLKAVAHEVLQAKSLLKLPQLMEQAAKHVRTDMSMRQALYFAKEVAGLNFDSMQTVTLKGSGRMIGGVSYVQLDDNHLKETIHLYLRWQDDSDAKDSKTSSL